MHYHRVVVMHVEHKEDLFALLASRRSTTARPIMAGRDFAFFMPMCELSIMVDFFFNFFAKSSLSLDFILNRMKSER